MENSETKNADSSQCVRVAVNIRPLITSELLVGCTDCISVVPGEPQVSGMVAYLYKYIYVYVYLGFCVLFSMKDFVYYYQADYCFA